MACGISSGLSAHSRRRLRMQLWAGDEEYSEPEPCLSPSLCGSPTRAPRCQGSHQPSLQTLMPLRDPSAGWFGEPKWPRGLSWRHANSPRAEFSATAPAPDVHSESPLPQLPSIPLTLSPSPEEEALSGRGPLSSLNLTRPRRYGMIHPRLYGEQDREGFLKRTLLESSTSADKVLRQRLRALRFPKLDMLQPQRRHRDHHERARGHGRRRREAEKRTVTLPRSIRSNIIVDAQGRRVFTEMSLELPERPAR
eukprot:TRINITY_DN26004_c1_g1_i1.p1 TRINITY_DN26004_c1_g1~~TRINITY_DN26004_c1_g1_i1.p1  ORF type:complete len:290 (+),score=75.11 TRINITY_DN26004_c1_g1_i1:115-870(+)